jgi:phosphoglycerol transferase MdoB-like AlkP superfamily enzyme
MSLGHFLQLLWSGLPFDLSAILYVNLLYIVLFLLPFRLRYRPFYQKTAAGVFYLTNGVALAANCIDMVYFRFTLRRTTWSVFQEFANDAGNTRLLGRFFVDYWYIVLLFIGLVILMVWLYRRFTLEKSPLRNPWLYYGLGTCLMVACALLTVAGLRGGFTRTTRPISINNAATHAAHPAETGIVLNTPFSIIRTTGRKNYTRLAYFPEQDMEAIYSPVHLPDSSQPFTPKNVVIIILESVGREYIGALNRHLPVEDYTGYTPFLDSLIAHSLTFEQSFANGRKSIDAMPSVLAGIPSLTEPYVLSVYANNRIEGLAGALAHKGYDCSFFHGAPNGSMGFQAFASTSGFRHYYGKDEYANNADFDGFWGIWDEPFLQFMARTLAGKKEPFLASVFTASSHHPFRIPAQYQGQFPPGTLPIHPCIGYADHALRRFFATAATMPWYKNTLFVITADHTNQSAYAPYATSTGHFAVPLIFYCPSDSTLHGLQKTPSVQQMDIMPSTLGYLHYDKPFFAFGNNVFRHADTTFVINYFNGFYQVIQNGYMLQTNENGPHALYRFEEDVLLKNNLLQQLPETAARLHQLFQAFLQQYNNRLIDNHTTVDVE